MSCFSHVHEAIKEILCELNKNKSLFHANLQGKKSSISFAAMLLAENVKKCFAVSIGKNKKLRSGTSSFLPGFSFAFG